MIRRTLGETIEVKTTESRDEALVSGDSGHLEQVLMNLAVNAKDAMPQGGEFAIHVETVGKVGCERQNLPVREWVHLKVTDTGVGMSDSVAERVFEPFFTTKQFGQGTGLGLAICYANIREAGGELRVSTSPGEGTQFDIYLPRSEPARDERMSHPRHTPGGGETVLVVDDEPEIARVALRILQDAGYDALGACSAEEALRVVAQHDRSVDLLVTDMVMPKVGGRELANTLRDAHAGLRVLFMTGYAESGGGVQQGTRDEGGPPVLNKPFGKVAMLNKIREILDA